MSLLVRTRKHEHIVFVFVFTNANICKSLENEHISFSHELRDVAITRVRSGHLRLTGALIYGHAC